MSEPAWVVEARRYVGQSEVPGKGNNPFIASLWIGYASVWRALGSDDSSAPWCGMFVAHCLRTAGLPVVANPYRARAWLAYGTAIPVPVYGCLAIYARSGGGHVNFIVGRDERGRDMGIGGNQGDRVSIAPFDRTRLLGYRWVDPKVWPIIAPVPLLAANGVPSSTNEA